MVTEQLRQHGSHETLREEIERYSSARDLDEAFERRLDQLEEDFGREPVALLFSALYASREGLTETELREISGLSRLALSPLLFALDFNILQGDGPLRFGHDYLHRAVRKHYFSTEESEVEWHRRLARYFREEPPSERTSGELAWQLHRAGDRAGLIETLTSIDHFLFLYDRDRRVEVMSYWSGLREEFDLVEAYERGLERWRADGFEAEREIEVLRNIADLFDEVGEWQASRRFSEEHRERAIAEGNRLEEARALSSLALTSIHMGEYDEALGMLEQGRLMYEEIGDTQGIEVCIGNSAQIFMMRRELDRAEDVLLQAAELARDNGRQQNMIKVEGNLGIINLMQENYLDALKHLDVAANLARDLGDYRSLAIATGNMGHAYLRTDQPERALECFREDERVSRRVGDVAGVSRGVSNMSSVYIELGRYDEARAAITESEMIDRGLGDRNGIASALGNRGIIEAGFGEYKRALETFREQRRIHRELGNPIGVTMADEGISMVSLESGEYELGFRTSLQAIDDARAAGNIYLLGKHLEHMVAILLAIHATSEVLPEYVDEKIDRREDRERRLSLLDRAEEMAREAIDCAEKLSGDPPSPDRALLLVKVLSERALLTSEERSLVEGIEKLRERLDRSTDDLERAELHFGLFEIAERQGKSTDSSDHDAALRLYTKLYRERPLFSYRARLDRLAETGRG